MRSEGAWLRGLLENRSQDLVENARTRVESLSWNGNQIPVSVTDCQTPNNSYVCSQYAALLTYASHGLTELAQPFRNVSRLSFQMAGQLLRWGSIDRSAGINNWLTSTPLYPVDCHDYAQLHEQALRAYPEHALVLRGLNSTTDSSLMTQLLSLGYFLLPSRAVFLFDGRVESRKSRDYKRDLALLGRSDWSIVSHSEIRQDDFSRMKELYGQLFLEKHNPNNPQCTRRLMELWHRDNQLEYFGLRRNGRLDGVVAIFQQDQKSSIPMLGYDTTIEQSAGLYRRLMALALKHAEDNQLVLNLSAGASDFKRNRGGVATLDYTAVYCGHLSSRRRLVWRALNGLLCGHWGPYLEESEGIL